MSQNLMIDPTKRDYIIKNGSPVPTDRIFEASYFALTIPKTKYLYEVPGVEQGSLLWTMQNRKRTDSIEQEYASYSRQAIESQVIATEQATEVEIENLEISKTGTSNEIAVRPSANQISTEFNFVSV